MHNPLLALLIAIVMAFVTWLVLRFYGRETAKNLKFILSLPVFVPIFVIFTVGCLQMLSADPSKAQQIADKTIGSLISFAVGAIPDAIIGDIGGIIFGAILYALTGRRE
jgi:ABC-type spermidine/putrescine transport system permease subunit II